MQTDADTEAGRGEGPPTREQMADHVEDIGQRLQAGDLSPEKAGGALQYLARRLRQSDPGGREWWNCPTCEREGDGSVISPPDALHCPMCGTRNPAAPTDEAPEGDPYDGEEACPNINCGRGWGHEGPCDASPGGDSK